MSGHMAEQSQVCVVIIVDCVVMEPCGLWLFLALCAVQGCTNVNCDVAHFTT